MLQVHPVRVHSAAHTGQPRPNPRGMYGCSWPDLHSNLGRVSTPRQDTWPGHPHWYLPTRYSAEFTRTPWSFWKATDSMHCPCRVYPLWTARFPKDNKKKIDVFRVNASLTTTNRRKVAPCYGIVNSGLKTDTPHPLQPFMSNFVLLSFVRRALLELFFWLVHEWF